MPRPGDIVGEYEIEALLGEGGMARVYRARHRARASVHALKVLHVRSASIQERMIEEGRLQSALRHPHIVGVSEVLDVDGVPVLVMELVEGGSLDGLLRKGRLPYLQAETIFRAVVSAVAVAHRAGLVHRDLKPGNVLLSRGEAGELVPKVTDFGIAKLLGDEGAARTASQVSLGTPAYMAPEQVRDASRVDHRADIWSLGVMLYELLCGKRPFRAEDSVSLLYAVVEGRYPDPLALNPELPARALAAIRGCLVTERERRIPDCGTLEAVLDGRETWAERPAEPDTAALTFDAGALAADPPPGADTVPLPPRASASPPLPELAWAAAPSPPAGRRDRRGLWLLLPALVAILDLLSPLDVALQYPVLRATRGPLPATDVAILGVNVPDVKALRAEHPGTLRALREAGVRAVLFDLALSTPSPMDEAIAGAVAELRAAGVTVVLPVRVAWDEAVTPAHAALARGALGLVEAKEERFFGTVRAAPVERVLPDGRRYWHASVLAVAAQLGREPPRIEGDALIIGPTHNPIAGGLFTFSPPAEAPVVPYAARGRYSELAGKVVVLGVYGGTEDIHETPDGPRYGVEIEAALIQSLLRQAGLKVLAVEWNALLALLTGGATALLSRGLRPERRALALLIPAAAALIGLIAASAGVLVGLSPAVLAGILGLWVAGRPPTGNDLSARPRPHRPSTPETT